jgi:hypothetical protein
MIINEKTNDDLTLDTSTLLGGTADIFGSYVKQVDVSVFDGSLYWRIDSSLYTANGLPAS